MDAQVVDELRELCVGVGQVAEFVGGGPDEIDQVLVGSQETILDHGGDGNLEVDRSEKTLVSFDVLAKFSVKVGGSGCQANNDRTVEQFLGVGQDPSPVAQQVMAFIEDDQADAGVLESSQCFDRRAMQRPHRVSADRESITNGLLVSGQPRGVVLGIAFLEVLDPEVAFFGCGDLAVFEQVHDPVLEAPLLEIVAVTSWHGHRLVG